jgi:hypothetical protein
MATSGATDFSLTRNKIIRAAARKIPAVRAGGVMGSAMIEDFNEALNAMVKHWQARPVTVDSVSGPNIIVQSRGRAPAI